MPPVVRRSTSSTATPTPARAGGKAPLRTQGTSNTMQTTATGRPITIATMLGGAELIWPKGIDKRNPPTGPTRTNFQSHASRLGVSVV